MSRYTDHAIRVLKDKGYRITQPRRLVIQSLDDANDTLSAYQIKDILDVAGERVDTVSIYRILDCLEENHLVHRLRESGRVRKCALEEEAHCHLDQDDHCHHLLVCRLCQAISEIHCPGMASVVSDVSDHSGFRVENHHLEFTGVCKPCQTVPPAQRPG